MTQYLRQLAATALLLLVSAAAAMASNGHLNLPAGTNLRHTFWRINWGQNYLSQLSDETGGESYYLGSGAPVSFSPYLGDLGRRLLHQCLLTFQAKPVKKTGMQSVKLRTEVSNAELVAADRVYVPASE